MSDKKLADRVKELEDQIFEMSSRHSETELMYREQMSATIEAAEELLEEIDSQAELGGPTFDGSDPLKAALKVLLSPRQVCKSCTPERKCPDCGPSLTDFEGERRPADVTAQESEIDRAVREGRTETFTRPWPATQDCDHDLKLKGYKPACVKCGWPEATSNVTSEGDK